MRELRESVLREKAPARKQPHHHGDQGTKARNNVCVRYRLAITGRVIRDKAWVAYLEARNEGQGVVLVDAWAGVLEVVPSVVAHHHVLHTCAVTTAVPLAHRLHRSHLKYGEAERERVAEECE